LKVHPLRLYSPEQSIVGVINSRIGLKENAQVMRDVERLFEERTMAAEGEQGMVKVKLEEGVKTDSLER
jgi:hypothetical protein